MMKPWVDKYVPPKHEIAGILELDFDNVLPGHGEAVIEEREDNFIGFTVSAKLSIRFNSSSDGYESIFIPLLR